ncbi:MAG TPA: hypothetical protein VGZ32_02505 [Actinocrinis sp.]|jgi:hypothetical protein|uniref:hypothetical protein n=1 Tax=Actinocrinis sp. TaxID=1920516 RepID=UPI002DDD4252|nr:hypothetical protein [Actinocrinis sp.]HEV3169178.1 hypothetical protein [Actinocrinis sp.]
MAITTSGRDVATAPTAGYEAVRRTVIVLGLLALALIHLLDLQSKLRETPYLGGLYIALIASSIVIAQLLMRRDHDLLHAAAALLAAAAMVGYVLSRTTGLPASSVDIGNWLEPLGLASLFVEAVVILACLPVKP